MKKKLLFGVMALLWGASVTTWAQEQPTLMKIHQETGVQAYPLNAVQRVSFGYDNLYVRTPNGEFDHLLSAIKKVTFAKKTTDGVNDVQQVLCRVFTAGGNALIAESSATINRLQVLNLAGQVVYDNAVNQQRLMISTSAWASGIYIVLADTEAGRDVHKVLVK